MFQDLAELYAVARARSNIEGPHASGTNGETDVSQLKAQIRKLEETIGRMARSGLALTEIVRERLEITEVELVAKMQEIEQRGAPPEPIAPPEPVNFCQNCRHSNAPNRHTCLYCGEPLPAAN